MNLFKRQPVLSNADDATLVMHALGGNRDAFCLIVSRYQTLLCSLAYSSLGDIKHSEDMAQEAFIEAWKSLDTLRDPQKLKSWLCGILRFRISHFRRKETTQPVAGAQDIDLHDNATQPAMDDTAIQQQQQVLMWQVLKQMDDVYREPLILFYREQQSVERVAEELDLSVDTAKQRLSRGRKLLKEAMTIFVEDALEKSKPGAGFAAAVMLAINTISPPAKAAILGGGATKAGSLVKFTTLLTIIGSGAGLISSFFGVRSGLDQSRTQRERRMVIKVVSLFMLFAALFTAAMFGLRFATYASPDFALTFAIASQVLVALFTACYLYLTWRMGRDMKTLRVQERIFHPEAFLHESDQPGAKQREYKSKLTLFGVPLVHLQFGMPEHADEPVYAWIAGGQTARGLLFAWGGVAIAPVSVGIISVGVVTIGAIGVGVFSMGTVAFGLIGFGASAVAYKAYSSLSSLGWESALSGGFAMAHDAALGAIAFAHEANTDKAAEVVKLAAFEQHYPWVMALIAVLVIVPAAWHARKVRQRMRVPR